MPTFIYRAKKGVEEVTQGSIEAPTQDEANALLVAQGLFPIAIEPQSPPSAGTPSRKKYASPFSKIRVSSKEILLFTQKLSTLIRAKVELLSALKIIYEQLDRCAFKDVVLQIYNATKQGNTFSDSLAQFPQAFPPLFVNIIKSGEASGRIDFALEQINEFLSREQALAMRVQVALAYPSLLLSVGIVSIMVLMNFVIPKLKPIIESSGKELPLITRAILKFSVVSSKTWMAWLVIAVAVVMFLGYQRGGYFLKMFVLKLRIHLPLIKRLTKNQELAHFSRSLALLLSSGVVALKSLEIASATIENPILKSQLQKAYQQIAQGKSFAKSMEESTSLPPFFVRMVAVGEESGRLGEVLSEIARSYTQTLETDILLISSLLEPLLILFLGLILGTIVLAILLPTFQITQFVQ